MANNVRTKEEDLGATWMPGGGLVEVYCEICGGSGFSKPGNGYDSVCDECGGRGVFPK